MKGFPDSVTRAQVQAAVESLGIPLAAVTAVTLDYRRGVIVQMYVTDDEGRKVAHAHSPLMTELTIPYGAPDQEVTA